MWKVHFNREVHLLLFTFSGLTQLFIVLKCFFDRCICGMNDDAPARTE